MSYQSEKFNQARRALMLPHAKNEAASIAGEIGGAEPHECERSKKERDGDMAERHAPSKHARASEKIQGRAENERPEKATRVAERGVHRERRAASAGLGAARATRRE